MLQQWFVYLCSACQFLLLQLLLPLVLSLSFLLLPNTTTVRALPKCYFDWGEPSKASRSAAAQQLASHSFCFCLYFAFALFATYLYVWVRLCVGRCCDYFVVVFTLVADVFIFHFLIRTTLCATHV